jgi:hypothetical protein
VKIRAGCTLATLFMLCFTVAVWSSPLDERGAAPSRMPETQSASGRIASVVDAEFTITVGKDQDKKQLQFVVDNNTKVDGQLSVGAQATVDFKLDSGKNVAIHIIVTPTSGLRAN